LIRRSGCEVGVGGEGNSLVDVTTVVASTRTALKSSKLLQVAGEVATSSGPAPVFGVTTAQLQVDNNKIKHGNDVLVYLHTNAVEIRGGHSNTPSKKQDTNAILS